LLDETFLTANFPSLDFSKNAEVEQNTGKNVLNHEEYLKKIKEERLKNNGGNNFLENKPSYFDNDNKNNSQGRSENKNDAFIYEDYLRKKNTITKPNYVNNKKEMDFLESDFNKLGNNFSNFPNNYNNKNFSDNDFMKMPNQFSNNNNNSKNFDALNFTMPNNNFEENLYENIDLDNTKPKKSIGFNNNYNMNIGMDNYGRQSNNNFPGNNYMNTNNMMNFAMTNPQIVNTTMSHMTLDNMNRGMNTMNQMNNVNFNNNQQNNNNDFFDINNLNFPK
jgi:hypothetical protein